MSARRKGRGSGKNRLNPPVPRARRPTWRYWVTMGFLVVLYQGLFVLFLHRSLILAIGVLVGMVVIVLGADRAFNLGSFFFE